MKRRVAILVALTFLLSAASLSAQVSGQAQESSKAKGKLSNKLYVVQMAEPPVVSYAGGVKGLKATKPAPGQKIDPNSAQVIAYAAYLDASHASALTAIGGGRKVLDYRYSYNGFAAEITPAQAEALKKVPGVVAVTKDELQTQDTSSTPAFLGLTTPETGLWGLLGGVGRAGEDIIIGDIDSGIWPESPSFSDRTGSNGNETMDGKLSYQQIPGWHGKCTPGQYFPASLCNQKLIGAQYFNVGQGGDAGVKANLPWEFVSARDYNGHGSHTASTAGGNNGVLPTGLFAPFGAISGMAPRARIAMYKALWSTQDASTASGFTSDLVAAIDQAVADGVDVINYSISGSQTNFLDPAEVAFLYAADAGVFVSASAGNSGPTTSTVAHPSPWITTVAAGTHNRSMLAVADLGNDTHYTGASVTSSAVGPAPLINSTAAQLTGASAAAARLCYSSTWVDPAPSTDHGPGLDPALVAGKIVVCERGTNDRVDKSKAVKEAGGVGMILVNISPNTLNADFHSVPTVHLADTDRAAVEAYAGTTGATATINKSYVELTTPAPFTASFSSRGPLKAGNGDLLKPDVIAPGQDVLAVVSPFGNGGLYYNLYSGTSMSAPHVAGLAALLKQLHPNWTPMMIKSALMTTGYDVLDGLSNTSSTLIFRQGAGHVKPNNAADPGLVFKTSWNDWLAFLCGTTSGITASTCTTLHDTLGYSLVPSDLNTASIAIGSMAGSQTVTRKVTNVGSAKTTYSVASTGMAGLNVTLPAAFELKPGEAKSFPITFTRTTATFKSYTGGQLTLTGGDGHTVRIPMVVRPVALAAPASVFSNGGPIGYDVKFGYTGAFTAAGRGLVAALTNDGEVTTGHTVTFDVTIPAGSTYARFSLFDTNVSSPSDLDLEVYFGTTLVGSSGGSTSQEEVNFSFSPPLAADTTLSVHVVGFDTQGVTAQFTLFSWALGSTDAGNMAVSAPTSAVLGQTGAINLTFSGLISGTKYLGSVAYSGLSDLPNPTIVRVDVP